MAIESDNSVFLQADKPDLQPQVNQYGFYPPNDSIPPTISEAETSDSLRLRIESMRQIAAESKDQELSEKLVREIGYLTDVLVRRII